jgi:hypothetical protein
MIQLRALTATGRRFGGNFIVINAVITVFIFIFKT